MLLFCFYRSKAAKIKGCSDLKDWVDPIVNHFWFCCQTAEGSEERIKVTLYPGESHSSVEFNTYVDNM